MVTVFPELVAEGEVEDRMEEMAEAVGAAAGLSPGSWREPLDLDGMKVTLRAEHSDAPLERIRELSQGFDLMVLGAGPGAMARRDVLGRVTWTLATGARCPVVAVKRRTGGLHFQVQSFFEFFREDAPEGMAPKETGKE